MAWFNGKETKSAAEEQQELELKPEEVKAKLDKIDSVEATVTSMKSSVDSVSAWIAEQRQEREAALARQRAEAAKPKEITEMDWLTDPEAATREYTKPILENQINLSSQMLRRSILEDDPTYEFYTGDFKKEVDSYIDNLPFSSRANPIAIKNCYNVVLGQHANDLKEAKLKSRFAAASTSASGTGGTTTEIERIIKLTEEEKKAARIFGLTDEEYGKSKKNFVSSSELSYV